MNNHMIEDIKRFARPPDNYERILPLAAVFSCDAVFFGLHKLKPNKPVIIKNKGFRIEVNDMIALTIPMSQISETHYHLESNNLNIISVSVTEEYAKQIESLINLIGSKKMLTDNYFTSERITMVCKKLQYDTVMTIMALFPRISLLSARELENILRYLTNTHNSSTKERARKKYALEELNSPSLPRKKAKMDADVTPIQTESKKQAIITPFDFSSTLTTPHDSLSKRSASTIVISSAADATVNTYPLTNSSPSSDARVILTYQHIYGPIELTVGDYMCLASKQYLNDKIIDFYMKYIHNNVITTSDVRRRTHIFSVYFYHVLTCHVNKLPAERRYERVKDWTKNVNIFEKDFLIVPINENNHWSVIVICFANMLLSNIDDQRSNNEQGLIVVKQPVILIFNSMDCTFNYEQTNILREYLICEYRAKFSSLNKHNFTEENLPHYCVKVPQQHNSYDCGVYVLQYIEEFFRNPLKDFRIQEPTADINQLKDWFDEIIIIRKREEIAKLIKRLINEHYQAMGMSPEIKLPEINFATVNDNILEESPC